MDASFYIKQLDLQPHPEGGYFKQTYQAAESIARDALPARFTGHRSFSTAIYYLLERGDFSGFHRIKSDECWHFYVGDPLLIHVISSGGEYRCAVLGSRVEKEETHQFVVPATTWFAAEPAPGSAFALVGCTVAPGFDFDDFEMGEKEKLLNEFPMHVDIISRLCR